MGPSTMRFRILQKRAKEGQTCPLVERLLAETRSCAFESRTETFWRMFFDSRSGHRRGLLLHLLRTLASHPRPSWSRRSFAHAPLQPASHSRVIRIAGLLADTLLGSTHQFEALRVSTTRCHPVCVSRSRTRTPQPRPSNKSQP